MSEAKHTPGPWAYREGRAEMRESSTVHKADDPEFILGHVICESVNKAQRTEDVANARLIAAAPDLLAACRRLLQWHFLDVSGHLPDSIVAAAEAAVAKATHGR